MAKRMQGNSGLQSGVLLVLCMRLASGDRGKSLTDVEASKTLGMTVKALLDKENLAICYKGKFNSNLVWRAVSTHPAGYRRGRTIHIAISNQVGFTTSQRDDARSTYWCTDIVKMIDAPVIHVNDDDPEPGALAIRLALAYRRKFAADIFVDLICLSSHFPLD